MDQNLTAQGLGWLRIAIPRPDPCRNGCDTTPPSPRHDLSGGLDPVRRMNNAPRTNS
jgi:hypothetical protein